MVKQLQNLAKSIRRQAEDSDGNVPAEADQVAEQLEKTANYLTDISPERIEAITRRLSQNAWSAIVVAFIVGLIVGWLLGRE